MVIGADDPGILRTNLRDELALIEQWPGVGRAGVERVLHVARASRSELLAGRPAMN